MDISLKHEDYKTLKILTDNSVEEVVECTVSLPEYMPDILRVIKAVAKPKVNSCSIVGDRVTVDGVCEVKMIYVADDGCIYVHTQVCPFSKYKESEDFSEAVDATVSVKVSYVNCRATGTKQADIKAGLSLKFNVYCAHCFDVISVDEDCCVEQKCVPVRAMSLGCRKTGQFAMSDTINLDEPCCFILSYTSSAVCTEIRKINNKLMVKGEAIVDICYVCNEDKSKTKKLRHILPINQIMEFEGMEERFTGSVILDVKAVDIIPKGESSGVSTVFEVSVGIDASVTMWEEKELTVVSDAYAVNSVLDIKKTPCTFYKALTEIREVFSAQNTFNSASVDYKEILDCCGEITSVNLKSEDGKLIISGSISLSLILKEENRNISNISKMLDFTFSRDVVASSGKLVYNPNLNLVSIECNTGSAGIDIRAELNIQCSVFEEVVIDTITELTLSDTSADFKRNAITVYFPSTENESLWSIARRYNTTVSAIADENNLEGDTTESLKVLFIPAV